MAYFARKRKTGKVAVDAWKKNYAQLEELFVEVVGFEAFVVAIADELLVHSLYGTILRVITGAVLSTIDAATDIITITTYFKNGLGGRAIALLVMIGLNLATQVTMTTLQMRGGWKGWVKEVLICVFFMKPAVDAYRVSANKGLNDGVVDTFMEMLCFKCAELAFESIPGCVLQVSERAPSEASAERSEELEQS